MLKAEASTMPWWPPMAHVWLLGGKPRFPLDTLQHEQPPWPQGRNSAPRDRAVALTHVGIVAVSLRRGGEALLVRQTLGADL